MKRIMAFAIVALMFFITSCGASENVLIDFITDDGSGTDFGGYTIHAYGDGLTTVFGDNDQTLQYEVFMDRIAEIQDNCNCTVSLNWHFSCEDCKLRVLSGSSDADLVKYSGYNALQDWADAGLLLPITDFSGIIDLSDTAKYGGANILEAGMVDSVPYAVQPLYWPGNDPLDCFILIYNKDLFAANSIMDLHEYYENGTWTWDTFDSFFSSTDVLVSGESIPLFMTTGSHLFSMLIYSNGVQFIKKDESGDFVADPYSTNFTKALEWGMDFVSKYKDKIYLSSDYWNIDDYLSGNILMALATANDVTTGSVAYNDLGDFTTGLMPFPCGPNAEYGQWAQTLDRSYGFGITSCSNEPEIAASVLSLLCDPFEEFGGSAGLQAYYEQYVFSDSVDAQIFTELGKYSRYNYEFSGGGDLMRSVNNYFGDCLSGTKSASQCMESYKDTLTSIIEKNMLENYEYMYDNYYSKQG